MTTIDIDAGAALSPVRPSSFASRAFECSACAPAWRPPSSASPASSRRVASTSSKSSRKARFHDVVVEKVGSDMRLVVGDRAVRLERRDADHLGELLTARWAGGVWARPR